MLSRSAARGVSFALALAAMAYGTATIAQDGDRAKAGLNVWRSSSCADCHGPFADGEQEDDDYPAGANLRTSRIEAAALKMTISCGRPGTGMPSFDEGAYTVRACYGRSLGARPDNLQPTPRPAQSRRNRCPDRLPAGTRHWAWQDNQGGVPLLLRGQTRLVRGLQIIERCGG
jgi:mono/diheme cytochrome c family protein